MAQPLKMFIDGQWVSAASGDTYPILNPATEEIIARAPRGGPQDVKAAIDAARRSFDKGVWSSKSPGERAAVLLKLADLVEQKTDVLAKIESQNVGKSIKYAQNSDLPFIVDNLRYFAGAARLLNGSAAAEYSGLGTSFIRREPIGVVAAIVPWNYPLYIAVWKLAPALAAGNSIILKPASSTPLSLLEFVKFTEQVGLPPGVFNVITGAGEVMGPELARSPKVDMLALTGDTATGKALMAQGAPTLKHMHLELGGKAPLLVLSDADLESVAQGAVIGAFWNSGQDCTAVTRLLVPKQLEKKLLPLLIKKAKQFRIGNPLDETTDMGPLVSGKQRERVETYIKNAVSEGAQIATGGRRPPIRKGFFLQPTILTNTTQDMKINQEEVFGPVLAVQTYTSVDHAIKAANAVQYGLASSVWGRDVTACLSVANQFDFGTVWINDHGALVSEMPHGGFKQSGFGKDLSLSSFEEFTRVKHVYIDMTGKAVKPWHWTVLGKKP